jgi:trigger factor
MVAMKTEFTDVSDTRKHLSVEVPPDIVDAEIERITKHYSRSARVPGFRPGKVPAKVVRQRYKDQILYDAAQGLIPRVVGDALRERGLEPVATPDIKDVVIEEGQPLTFLADFETLPPIDPGTYTDLTLRKPPAVLEVGAVDRALEHLQARHARWHTIEDRPAAAGDTLILNLTRTRRRRLVTLIGEPPAESPADEQPEHLENVPLEIGATINPPGADEHLTGAAVGETRSFTSHYPTDDETVELRGATIDFTATVTGIRRRELLPLDDDFAKEVGDTDTLDALRERIRTDLQQGAEQDADHQVRHELLQQLSARLQAAPDVLVDREIDRRLEELVRRLLDQGVDPTQTDINWQDYRERQRPAALQTVKSTLVVDEIARREAIAVTEEELAAEVETFAERSGRTPAAVRARLEQEGALDRIRIGIRREKTMRWLLDQATIVSG